MLLILKLGSHYTAMINNPAVSKFGPEAIKIYEPLNFNSCSNTKYAAAAPEAAASVYFLNLKEPFQRKLLQVLPASKRDTQDYNRSQT